jgi:hypothetical protein
LVISFVIFGTLLRGLVMLFHYLPGFPVQLRNSGADNQLDKRPGIRTLWNCHRGFVLCAVFGGLDDLQTSA